MLILLSIAACSRRGDESCTDDCGGAYQRNPVLVNKVIADTGLPICENARIFQSTDVAREFERPISDYGVTLIMESYCPDYFSKQLDARLGKEGQAVFQSRTGAHVTVYAVPYSTYVINVWREPKDARH